MLQINSIRCSRSKITVDCINEIPAEMNLATAKNAVESFIRVVTDTLGFTVACGYDVEITSAYNLETKANNIFGVHENIFDDQKINLSTSQGTAHPLSPSIGDIIATAVTSPQLTIALADFRESIRQPAFTVFHCYQALESLKYSAPDIKDDQKKWSWLLSTLKISKATKDRLLKLGAGEQRHGKACTSIWEERKWAMSVAWEAIRRYVIFIRDKTALIQCDEL